MQVPGGWLEGRRGGEVGGNLTEKEMQKMSNAVKESLQDVSASPFANIKKEACKREPVVS